MRGSHDLTYSSKYFFDYLAEDLQDQTGLMFFALYGDLRRFIGLCDFRMQAFNQERSKAELKQLIKEHATQVFKDYIVEQNTFDVEVDCEPISQLRLHCWDASS